MDPELLLKNIVSTAKTATTFGLRQAERLGLARVRATARLGSPGDGEDVVQIVLTERLLQE
jgi:hypothetical protein